MPDSLLTLPEFAEVAALAVEASGALPDSRQAKAVPAVRMIRYYTARGLLPRPGTRGRSLVYGRRHLLQLVAIKRLQGQGMALDEIAGRLAGISDSDLAALAALADGVMPANLGEVEHVQQKEMSRSAGRFWESVPAEGAPAVVGRDAADLTTDRAARAAGSRPPRSVPAAPALVAKAVTELRLSDSVRLLVERRPGEMPSLEALRAAAAPLLKLLASKAPDPDRKER